MYMFAEAQFDTHQNIPDARRACGADSIAEPLAWQNIEGDEHFPRLLFRVGPIVRSRLFLPRPPPPERVRTLHINNDAVLIAIVSQPPAAIFGI